MDDIRGVRKMGVGCKYLEKLGQDLVKTWSRVRDIEKSWIFDGFTVYYISGG